MAVEAADLREDPPSPLCPLVAYEPLLLGPMREGLLVAEAFALLAPAAATEPKATNDAVASASAFTA